MPTRSSDNAGVHVPPPVIYFAGLLLGWLLDKRWPLPISASNSPLREFFAAMLLAFWLTLMLTAVAVFRRARTAIIPNQPASSLVTSGPYRFTRNPMYVSFVAMYAGVTLMMNSWWPAFLLPVVIVVIGRLIIRREEGYLARAFPEEYSAYTRRVRRWL